MLEGALDLVYNKYLDIFPPSTSATLHQSTRSVTLSNLSVFLAWPSWTSPGSNGKALAKQQRHKVKAKASKKYYCEVCELACTKKYEFERHNVSRRHLNNVKKANSGVVKNYRCEICSYACTKPIYLEMHKAGKRHLQRVAKAST